MNLLRDDILTDNGDGEYSFNRARWEYDLLMGDSENDRDGKTVPEEASDQRFFQNNPERVKIKTISTPTVYRDKK